MLCTEMIKSNNKKISGQSRFYKKQIAILMLVDDNNMLVDDNNMLVVVLHLVYIPTIYIPLCTYIYYS